MNREQCYIYKVYLLEFEVNNRSNGYAVVSARNMKEATLLLQNHGVNHENYKIVTVKECIERGWEFAKRNFKTGFWNYNSNVSIYNHKTNIQSQFGNHTRLHDGVDSFKHCNNVLNAMCNKIKSVWLEKFCLQ